MSLLQEHHDYIIEILENTGSTKNQLESFLNESGYSLNQLLFRRSVYNLYLEYLNK